MGLSTEHKETEAGVIPEEWEALPASKIGAFKGGSGFPLTAQGETNGEYPFFKVSDMNNEGNETFMTVSNHYISEQTRGRLGATAFPADSIVFAKVGAAIFLERKKILGQPSCIDNNMAAFLLDKSRADVRFVHMLLLNKKLGDLVATTALPALNGKQLGDMVLAVPPLPEQRAVAAALSDVGALMDGLNRLIAKKRNVKQAAMQSLLTGKTRLPGFHGEWGVTRIREFTNCVAGGTPSTFVASYWGGSIKWMSSGELHLKRVEDVAARITEDGLRNSAATILPKRCVLVGLAGQGKTRGTVAINLVGLSTNQSIAAVLPSPAFVPEYLYYNLDRRYDELRDLSSGGGGRGGLNLKLIGSIPIPLPSIAEQTAIAAVLTDMDAELSALEARRDKTRDLKKAMMQELLTGKTRLVPAGAPRA